ncbi:hypothetical protein [Streptomyces sp. NPDC059909]|uniref:hypothetical protein n=1 Tax=Streptomyces sp. NPDC059909 TaxID=3346998 RepID=UPI0036526ADD
MEPRDDDAVPYAALLAAYWLKSSGRDALDSVVGREGRCGRDVMVMCSTATVAAAVVLAVMGRLT